MLQRRGVGDLHFASVERLPPFPLSHTAGFTSTLLLLFPQDFFQSLSPLNISSLLSEL